MTLTATVTIPAAVTQLRPGHRFFARGGDGQGASYEVLANTPVSELGWPMNRIRARRLDPVTNRPVGPVVHLNFEHTQRVALHEQSQRNGGKLKPLTPTFEPTHF